MVHARSLLAVMIFATIAMILVDTASAQSPWPAYGARRGRIRIVHGPLRSVYRIHWGNGISPEGAAVLVAGIEGFTTVADAYLGGSGREEEEGARDAIQKGRSSAAQRSQSSPAQNSRPAAENGARSLDTEGTSVRRSLNELLTECDSLLRQLNEGERLARAASAGR